MTDDAAIRARLREAFLTILEETEPGPGCSGCGNHGLVVGCPLCGRRWRP